MSKQLYVKIYEKYYGPVPKGYHVHHVDFDSSNNDPKNLIAITPSEHSRIHQAAGHMVTEQFILSAIDGGIKGGRKCVEEKLGFLALEHRAVSLAAGRQNGIDNRRLARGIFSPDFDRSAHGKIVGKKSGRIAVEHKIGIFDPVHRRQYAQLGGRAAVARGSLNGAKGTITQIAKGIGIFSPEVRQRVRSIVKTKGKRWVNNGTENRMVYAADIPSGWSFGRIYHAQRPQTVGGVAYADDAELALRALGYV